ncbi:PilN domain-containing protein [Paenibacillus agricola]|uniref:Tfp pilus assembly protein PilN n=1 Tax=Paenibacillus agricola TaxID=2716264 RepID=A0ABX0JAG4_9BACL|nr:hypothetical protein [Paenibacillus agricola]NHN30735.1 hypothetical protein [Paenibacillus agricola]
MRNINLLPKIPIIRRIYIPLVISTLAVSVLFAGGLMLYGVYLKAGIAQKEAQSKELSNSIQSLRLQKTMDEQTKNYQALTADIAKLKQERQFWLPLIELITIQLPEVARIQSMGVVAGANDGKIAVSSPQAAAAGSQVAGTGQKLAITAEFGALEQTAEYVLRLQQSPLLENVLIKSIQRVDGEIPIPPAPIEVIPPIPPSSGTTLSPEEEFKRIMETKLTPAESKGDELLNELSWTINQQMVEQQFGIEVPDQSLITPEDTSADVSMSFEEIIQDSPITLKELNEAKKNLELFKQYKLPEQPVTTLPPVAVAPTVVQTKKYTKFQVQLELTLKVPNQIK